MATESIVRLPTGYFPDFNIGRPLFNGNIYVGKADKDPKLNPIDVQGIQEDGTRVALSQPVSIGAGGVPTYNGSPIQIVASETPYSLLVEDRNNAQEYYFAITDGESVFSSSVVVKFKPTTTAGQTIINVPDQPGAINVIVNGSTLQETDADYTYNSANGNIELATALVATDTVEIQYGQIVSQSVNIVGGAMKQFETVAQMIADTELAVGETVATQGYYSAGDGAGAKYFIVPNASVTVDGFGNHQGVNGICKLEVGLVANLLQYGLVADVTSGNSSSGTAQYQRIQAALDGPATVIQAPSYTGQLILIGESAGESITIPGGKSLIGTYSGIDSPFRSPDKPLSEWSGTIFVRRGDCQIFMNGNTRIDEFTIYQDNQNWGLDFNGGQPDGIDPWIDNEPQVEYIGDNLPVEISNIVTLGSTRFFRSKAEDPINVNRNLEKPVIKNIRGFPLLTGIEIQLSTDMIRIEDVQFNPNSMTGLPGFTTSFAQSDKYLRNIQAFRFGRVDGGWLSNCFIFACKNFVNFDWQSPPEELWPGGVGGSVRLEQCAADICHNFINIEASQIGFGITASNCWSAISNWQVLDDDPASATYNTVVTRRPSFVRFGTKADDQYDTGNQDRLKELSVDVVGCYAYGFSDGRFSSGQTAIPENLFNFDTNAPFPTNTTPATSFGQRLVLNVNDFTQFENPIFDPVDPTTWQAAMVSGLKDDQNHNFCIGNFRTRDVRTSNWTVIKSANYNSQGNTYTRNSIIHNHFPGGSSTDTAPARHVIGRDSTIGASETPAIKEMFKNSSNEVVYLQILRGLTSIFEINGDREHIRLGLGDWNEGALVIGTLQIWQENSNLRGKNGQPASATDGTIIATL